ncbi:DNA translocase FtsK [Sulfitobacter pontiacus]
MSDLDDLLGPAPSNEQPEHYELARALVLQEQRASTSWLQRELTIGYNKAATLMEALEANGVVSAADQFGKREVLESADEDHEPIPTSGKKTAPKKKPIPQSKQTHMDASVVQALTRPVSITFLSEVLRQDRKGITRKLATLPPIAQYRGNVPLYDFRQALEYLVKPKINAAEMIKKMGTDDLPMGLQKDVWDARLKQQKWMEQAGDLWRTEEVLSVLGEAFQRLKTTTQLWIDQLAESHALPAEVRKDLTGMVDGLQKDLHATLVEMPADKATRSQLGEIEGTDLDV